MIRYTLTCDNDHHFESWFQSGDAFERLLKAGMVNCDACGSAQVSKTIMAPAIPKKEHRSKPDVAEKLAALKKHIETNADYVGNTFYTEARAMHDGEKPARAIYGQADAKQAKSLIEDGIPVMPLPFIPKKQTN
ncbi:hypothetical protein SAMN04488515_0170 [Cognatiyoonia koreensis]|uniref:DUF1178 family protein n=1 Tax=Cognatiyoonia koreensis TaxID=364200 RepID=A0A1I0MR15_9RHOB|nr:DUF1178 family protein [Cognatiyoonia koreensis]SEV90736.1 hypothetical protein SAMN04488515_0170 [Cognatiyoonia koreensis]